MDYFAKSAEYGHRWATEAVTGICSPLHLHIAYQLSVGLHCSIIIIIVV